MSRYFWLAVSIVFGSLFTFAFVAPYLVRGPYGRTPPPAEQWRLDLGMTLTLVLGGLLGALVAAGAAALNRRSRRKQ